MTHPIRLQLSRRKGFNLQAWSREVNGLAAVNVARPSKWGNPYRVDPPEYAVELFIAHLKSVTMTGVQPAIDPAARAELRGKNLACWCAPGAPCHADVLLEIANR